MKIPGIAHRSDLAGLGITDADRRRLLRRGRMSRAGTWYVTDEAPQDLVSLLAQGVRPTCVSAALHHGLWVPLHEGDHVYRPRGLAAVEPRRNIVVTGRDAAVTGRDTAVTSRDVAVPGRDVAVPGRDMVMHGSAMRSWPDRAPIADLPLALEHAMRCLSVRDAAILLESALNRRKISMGEVERLLAALPAVRRAQLARVTPLSESGTETAVRWWLESLHVPVTPQVRVAGVGRVDLKLGTSWIIECDSATYHDNPEQYHRDRARDLRLQARRYMVTRLTWEQVFLGWEETKAQLLTIIRRRDHRRPLAG
ncbi:MAG: hypothetical protein GX960_17365 [Actinomycetales bacterium]|mgnify:FL=1|nr:hypothetical protein [Actinomycetales bacterium]